MTPRAPEARVGRAPSTPAALSIADWRASLVRAGKEFLADDCMGLAQQIALYDRILAELGSRRTP